MTPDELKAIEARAIEATHADTFDFDECIAVAREIVPTLLAHIRKVEAYAERHRREAEAARDVCDTCSGFLERHKARLTAERDEARDAVRVCARAGCPQAREIVDGWDKEANQC